MRRRFIPCLNQQRKIYNYNYGSIIGALFFLVFIAVIKGTLWGLGAAGIGFAVGGWVSNQWHLGNIQRNLYWHLPYAKKWLDGNISESSDINEL